MCQAKIGVVTPKVIIMDNRLQMGINCIFKSSYYNIRYIVSGSNYLDVIHEELKESSHS
jgi:hypothetical protein